MDQDLLKNNRQKKGEEKGKKQLEKIIKVVLLICY